MYEKLVVITRKTRLRELIERFNTRMQAKFFIEHSGGDFGEYEAEDDCYELALEAIRKQIKLGTKTQFLDRSLLATYTFAPSDIVLVVGQDGLVANAAKYVGSQPIVGVNPDSTRNDGVLVPVEPKNVGSCLQDILQERAEFRQVTLAEAVLADGQRLLAFNDLYIGARTHISARYLIRYDNKQEPQSSSGLIISTGAGSTGWLSSVFNMVNSVGNFIGGSPGSGVRMQWDDPSLLFVVREPFVSKHSSAGIVAGRIGPGQELIIESTMTGEGTIFSDGIESDFLSFNAGARASIRTAGHKARLLVPRGRANENYRIAQPELGAAEIAMTNSISVSLGR